MKIPRNFDYPKPQKIDALKGVHGVSSDNVVIVDAQTILIPNFSYDGEAPGNFISVYGESLSWKLVFVVISLERMQQFPFVLNKKFFNKLSIIFPLQVA